jgi:hypothetical protein
MKPQLLPQKFLKVVTVKSFGCSVMGKWTEIFQMALEREFVLAQQKGESYVDVRAGDLHRKVGGYPGPSHRMPICCDVMLKNMQLGDKVLYQPPSGKGASLTIRYFSPRKQVPKPPSPESQTMTKELLKEKADAKFEDVARKVMSTHFGVPLVKGKAQGIPKEFDMISADGKIVGDAKYFTMVRGVSIPPAKFSTIAEHVWLLEKTSANCKFLIFGNDRRVPQEWLRRYGHLVKDVILYFLDEQKQTLEKLN